jgi:hypothetical protein
MNMSIRTAPKKVVAAIGAAVVLVGGAAFFVANEANNDASADTESCVSHDEYDRTDVFMSVDRVAEIYDVNGTYFDTDNADTFARIYHTLCWTDSEEIKVVYDQPSGLTIRWRLLDK